MFEKNAAACKGPMYAITSSGVATRVVPSAV